MPKKEGTIAKHTPNREDEIGKHTPEAGENAERYPKDEGEIVKHTPNEGEAKADAETKLQVEAAKACCSTGALPDDVDEGSSRYLWREVEDADGVPRANADLNKY